MMRSSPGMRPASASPAPRHRIDKDTSGFFRGPERQHGAPRRSLQREASKWYLAQAHPSGIREGAEPSHHPSLRPDERAACESLGSGRVTRPRGGVCAMRCRSHGTARGAPSPSRATWAGNAISCATHGAHSPNTGALCLARSAAEGRCALRPAFRYGAAGTAPWPALPCPAPARDCRRYFPPPALYEPPSRGLPGQRPGRLALGRRRLVGHAPIPPRGQTHRAYLGPGRQRSALKLHGVKAGKKPIEPLIEGLRRIAIAEGSAGEERNFAGPMPKRSA